MTAKSEPVRRCAGCLTELAAGGVCSVCHWDDAAHTEVHQHLPRHYLLLDRYYIGHVLGQGGFGITYLAYDLRLTRRVAVKEYFPSGFCDRLIDRATVRLPAVDLRAQYVYGLSRFLEEARTLAQLDDHPSIVPISEFVEANGTAYMVMTFLEGVTLKEYLARRQSGAMPWELAVQTLAPVMEALREVHMHGLLHRDISPDNIFLTDRSQVKLLDFGAARHAVGERSQSLSVIVKPGFGPEEQYRTNGKQGPWTDVYGVAATLYKCITGQTPPPAIDRLAEDTLRPLSALCESVPGDLEAVILKGMAVRATDRYQTIDAFQAAIASEGSADAPGRSNEISVAVLLTRDEAVNGCTKTVEIAGNGSIPVTISPDTQPGARLRLPGQAPGGGVLYVDVRIEEVAAEPPDLLPTYALYDDRSVALATLLGGPIAGSLLMAGNYRHLEQRDEANKILLLGLAGMGVSFLLGFLGQAVKVAETGVAIGMVVWFRSMAERDQGPAVAEHKARAGRMYSRWRATGIGLACLGCILGVIFFWMYAAEQIRDPRVTIGKADNVHYTGGATKEEALKLGNALRTEGYFEDRGVSVFLSKENGTTVSFVVKESRPDINFTFERIALGFAPSVGGLPLNIRLVTPNNVMLKEFILGQVAVDAKSHVYYLDSATEQDALSFAKALSRQGVFSHGAVDVFLSKGEGTTVSFPVQEGSWNNRWQSAKFGQVVRAAAPAIGGLPIRLRLLDSSLDQKKEITVE